MPAVHVPDTLIYTTSKPNGRLKIQTYVSTETGHLRPISHKIGNDNLNISVAENTCKQAFYLHVYDTVVRT
jgi:hypothetical protein